MTSRMDRRTFLQGASVASLTSMLPANAIAAPIALTAKKKEAAAPTAPGVAAKFNGGKSQVNLNLLQIGGDYPFLNCMKTAQAWSLIDNSGGADPSTLDSDGYPTSITNGGVYTVFFVPAQAQRPGKYVITWDGNGTIFCGNGGTNISGSKTSTSGNGRYSFLTNDTRLVVGISSIGNPRISNLRVFHEDDEAALNSGQIFGQKFVARLREANFGVIRFLNWQDGNTSNVTTWATRKPISHVFYAGTEFRASLYAGVTSNNGSDYTAQFPGFALQDKATVIVKFNVSNSIACTLNVNGTGKINILNEYSGPLSIASNSFPVGASADSLATLVYDAALNAWIKHGGDKAYGRQGLINGCPPELMVQLCALVGAHPHFVTPHLAIDPATDYMPKLAEYCRNAGPAWMIPRFEGPNELWNTAPGFFQTGYARAKATAYGWNGDFNNWYGKAMSVLGQAISTVYRDDRTKYQVLCGVQTALGSSQANTVYSNDRLASKAYVSQAAPPQEPYLKSPASKWVTHVCCAQYYTPSAYNTRQEVDGAAAYAAAKGNPNAQLAIATDYASTSVTGNGITTLPKVAIMYASWKAWALSFGIKGMCGYEGGYSPDMTSGGYSDADQLRAASKQVSILRNYTLQNYQAFVGTGGNGFTTEFPSCFQLSGMVPCENIWSVLEDIYQPSSPQWDAIVAFNHS